MEVGLCISGKFPRAASDASGGTACISGSTGGEDHELQWGRARSIFLLCFQHLTKRQCSRLLIKVCRVINWCIKKAVLYSD